MSPIRNSTKVRIMVKNNGILIVGAVFLCTVFILSLMLGTKYVPVDTVYESLFAFDRTEAVQQIVRDIRLPRSIAAALIGSFLALSGCIMQVLTRNPIAEPALLGVSHGAAFALVLTLAFFPTISNAGTMAASIVGAGISVFLVFGLALYAKGGRNPVKLALAGMALGMFLSSLTSAVGMSFNVAKDMSFWYAGGLSTIEWSSVKLLVMGGAAGLALTVLIARSLNVIHLGEDVAEGLGVSVHRVRALGVISVLLMTGSSVAVSGTIGFIGLVVPHICRMMVGHDHRYLLPASALFGGGLLVFADMAAKLVNPPYETPVGVVTALVGVPFFLYLVRKGRGASL